MLGRRNLQMSKAEAMHEGRDNLEARCRHGLLPAPTSGARRRPDRRAGHAQPQTGGAVAARDWIDWLVSAARLWYAPRGCLEPQFWNEGIKSSPPWRQIRGCTERGSVHVPRGARSSRVMDSSLPRYISVCCPVMAESTYAAVAHELPASTISEHVCIAQSASKRCDKKKRHSTTSSALEAPPHSLSIEA